MAEPLPQRPETTPVNPPRRSPPPAPLTAVSRGESRQIPLRPPPELVPQVMPSKSENFTSVSIQPGPKNETARITILPGPRAAAFDSIPRWFCWGLLGVSALIFLIQIWNYALS